MLSRCKTAIQIQVEYNLCIYFESMIFDYFKYLYNGCVDYLYNFFDQMSSHLLSLLKEGQLAQSGILSHLAELIRGSVENKSELKGLSNIQIFSYYLRRSKFNFKEFLQDQKLKKKVEQDKEYASYVLALE